MCKFPLRDTVWKVHNFSIAQKLREIDSRSKKSAISAHLEGLKFDFLHFLKFEIYQNYKFWVLKIVGTAILELLHSPRLNWMILSVKIAN